MRKSKVAWYFPKLPQSVGRRYAIALAAFLISFFLREALDTWLYSHRGFILFLPAILLVTFVAGLGPANIDCSTVRRRGLVFFPVAVLVIQA